MDYKVPKPLLYLLSVAFFMAFGAVHAQSTASSPPTPALANAERALQLALNARADSIAATDFAQAQQALLEAKQLHLADAVEHCDVAESPNEVVFTTSKLFQMFLKDPVLEATVKRVTGRPVRVIVKIGEVGAAPAPASAPSAPKPSVTISTIQI